MLICLALLVLMLFVLAIYLIIGYSAYKYCLTRNGRYVKKISKNVENRLASENFDVNFFNDNFKKIDILSDDNLKLCGFYKDNNCHKLAILVHGYGSNHKELAPQAKIFEKRGYDLLAIDMRCHGQSEGTNLTMGEKESQDLILWVKKMLEFKRDYKILLYGISMGASTVCLTLGNENLTNVVLAIEDCGYDNADKEFSYVFSKSKFKFKFLYKIFYNYTKKSQGLDLKKVDVVNKLKKSKVPILFIHGDSDTFVPTEMVYKLSSQIPENRSHLYIAKDAGHASSLMIDKYEYEKQISTFISKYYM